MEPVCYPRVGTLSLPENDRGVIYRGVMDTTNTTGWWSCPGCGVDAELPEVDLAGYEVPCPDCAEPMVLWREGVLSAA
jgi:hypothetical protein